MCRIDLTKTSPMMTTLADLITAKALLEEAQAQYDALADEVKHFMTEQDADVLCDGLHTVTYKPVTQKRLDTVALRGLLGDALDPYFKSSTYKRMEVKI